MSTYSCKDCKFFGHNIGAHFYLCKSSGIATMKDDICDHYLDRLNKTRQIEIDTI